VDVRRFNKGMWHEARWTLAMLGGFILFLTLLAATSAGVGYITSWFVSLGCYGIGAIPYQDYWVTVGAYVWLFVSLAVFGYFAWRILRSFRFPQRSKSRNRQAAQNVGSEQ
jgi:energy-coupling factor transporter transmembrane protein EcfT